MGIRYATNAEGHTAALSRLGEVRTLVLAKGDRFPENPRRFDQVIDEKGDAWVFDLPRNEGGGWMTEGEGGEDLLLDWFPRVEEG